MKDYYQILGLERKASKEEIKKAFRKLASQYHPDKKTGDDAKFKEISEAYSVLGDDKKRAEYDTYGRAFNNAGGAPGNGGFGGFDWSQANGFGNGVEFDLGDIFENFSEMFGGGFGARQSRRGNDVSIDLELPFREGIFGTSRTVVLNKTNTCTDCNGTGAKNESEQVTCKVCNGQGRLREARQSVLGSFTTVRECTECHGRGKVPKERCKTCSGIGVKRSQVEITIKVPAGINSGEVIRMAGQGEAVPGGTPGDLYIKLHVTPDPEIKREGHNLYRNVSVKLTDALLGAIYSAETLDGNIDIKIPEGVQHGDILKIKDKGVPTGSNRRGDFLVKIKIETPKKLSRKAKQLVENLKEEGI